MAFDGGNAFAEIYVRLLEIVDAVAKHVCCLLISCLKHPKRQRK